MSHSHDDDARIASTRNTARYFVETRHVAWVLLAGTVLWGLFSYQRMPKRKDPDVAVRVAAAVAVWPGASAERMEEYITRRIEEKIAENSKILKIESSTRGGTAVVIIELQEDVQDTGKQFDDIALKLGTIRGLPSGALPIDFIKDFGDTTALMLTVASPKVSDIELQLRADTLRRGIEAVRGKADPTAGRRRVTLAYAFPASLEPHALRRVVAQLGAYLRERDLAHDVQTIEGRGFLGVDGATDLSEERLRESALAFLQERMRTVELHPDVWRAVVIVDPAETEKRLAEVAESKYSYKELDLYTDELKRRLQGVAEVSKVSRSGVLPEQIYLEYSQDQLAKHGFQLSQLEQVLGARNITLPGGTIESGGKTIAIDPSGELTSESEIGSILLPTSGAPIYLRDLFEVTRDYENPPRFLNKYTSRDRDGKWQRTRAITLAVSMRTGMQIAEFGANVDRALAEARTNLPEDLILARTSDQPLQVEESVGLFTHSLYEAIALVVVIALIGFWEWRSAALLALSIPITLFMTYGFMHLVGIDLQQVSVASLIIALGLLVDDPVVAGDAIKRELSHGRPRLIASWWGPTRLGRAILFATITNIVAYLPFLTLPGDVGKFIYSLPIVLTASLVASRLVSMTFIPLLGFYFLRPPSKLAPSDEVRRSTGFGKVYSGIAGWAIDNRRKALLGAIALLAAGITFSGRIKTAFFPKDLSYLSYVDVWLPEDAPISETNAVVRQVDELIRHTLEQHERTLDEPRRVLRSITTFAGGGGPRFWYSVTPEQQQQNYAQMILEVHDKHDTDVIVPILQDALSAAIPGARIDVRQLENGAVVGVPVSFRISGPEIAELRRASEEVRAILRRHPDVERARDDWGADSFAVRLEVNPDRASLAGVTNLDVAQSAAAGLSGARVGQLRDGNRFIPIVARMRAAERAQLSDVQSLYVSSSTGERLPLGQVFDRLLRHADREDPAPQPLPHHHGRRLPRPRRAAVGGHGRGARRRGRGGRRHAARLLDRDRRRGGGAEEGLRQPGRCAAHLGAGHPAGPGHPVPQRGQAAHRVRRHPVRRRRRPGRPGGHGQPVRLHGLPRHHQPDRRDREPRDRLVRLHRGEARGGRAAAPGPDRRRHRAPAPGAHHRGRDRVRAVPAGHQRRAAVGAALLHADRRPDRGHAHHAAPGAGHLRHLRPRPQAGEVGAAGAPGRAGPGTATWRRGAGLSSGRRLSVEREVKGRPAVAPPAPGTTSRLPHGAKADRVATECRSGSTEGT